MKKSARGFTLIEILVVIGIIAILAGIVLVAINPARQFRQANDSQRTSNVNAILNAVGQRIADNRGAFNGLTGCTVAIPATAREIVVEADAGNVDANTEFNVACLTPTYLPSIPFDPSTGTASSTKYNIVQDSNGRITVSAVGQETTPITVTR